jgi:hypothetical protein
MSRRISTLAISAAATLALAGCGGHKTTTGTGPYVNGTHVSGIFSVRLTEYRLTPSSIHVVRFGFYGLRAINKGKRTHALAVKGPGVDQQTGRIPPGKSVTMLVGFLKAGRYQIYSPTDGDARKGMTGTIKVH